MAFDTPWQILDQNRLNIPGLMQAAGEAKTRRLQEMMLNRQIQREDREADREDKLLGVYAKLKQPGAKGGDPASSGFGGGATMAPPRNVPSGSPMGPQPAGQMGGVGGPDTVAQQAPPEVVQSWVEANRDVVGQLLTIDPGKAFALTEQLSKLDDAGKARVNEMNELRGRVALTLANVPQAQRAQALASLMPRLREMGITPEIVRQELGDLSDMSLQMAASLSQDVATLSKAQEEYTLSPGAARYRGSKLVAERPFAPRPITVGEGQTVVEYAPGGGGDIFSRMIGAESDGQQFALNGSPLTSPAGAIGIAQVMPGTAPEAAALAGLPWNEQRYRSDPDYNAAIGKAYFEKQLETFRDPALAVAAYNAGPGAVQNAVQKAGDNWLQALPAETQAYVGKVLGGGDPTSSGGARVIARGPPKQEKAPSGYRWTPQGTLAPIKGGPADKKGKGVDNKEVVNLRKEFNNLPEVKAFKEVRAGYQQVKAIGTKKNATAQDDIAMIFSFMKILDPNSVVRETEYATAQNAAGIPDNVRNMFNRALDGNRLNDRQRSEMVKTARVAYQQREATYNDAAGQYQGYARDLGIEPTTIARRYVPPKTKTAQGIARVKSDADYNKLPSGAMFIAPDGTRRKKP